MRDRPVVGGVEDAQDGGDEHDQALKLAETAGAVAHCDYDGVDHDGRQDAPGGQHEQQADHGDVVVLGQAGQPPIRAGPHEDRQHIAGAPVRPEQGKQVGAGPEKRLEIGGYADKDAERPDIAGREVHHLFEEERRLLARHGPAEGAENDAQGQEGRDAPKGGEIGAAALGGEGTDGDEGLCCHERLLTGGDWRPAGDAETGSGRQSPRPRSFFGETSNAGGGGGIGAEALGIQHLVRRQDRHRPEGCQPRLDRLALTDGDHLDAARA